MVSFHKALPDRVNTDKVDSYSVAGYVKSLFSSRYTGKKIAVIIHYHGVADYFLQTKQVYQNERNVTSTDVCDGRKIHTVKK